MTTPSPRCSINGFGVGVMAIVTAGQPIVATLENVAGVQPVAWRVVSTDELHDGGDYSFVQSGSSGEVFTGTALTAGTAGAIEVTVAGGINPATQLPDASLTFRCKWVVLTAEGLAVLTAGEVEGDALSSASHGAVAVLNAAIRVTAAAADRAIGPGPTTVANEVWVASGVDGVTLTRGPLLHVAQGGNALVTPRVAGDALELVPGANGGGAGPPLRLDVGTGSSNATRGNVWLGFRSGEGPSATLGAGGALLMKHVGTAPSGGTYSGERALYPKSDGWYESDGTTESKLAAGLTGAGAGTANAVLMVDATGNVLSRSGVTSDATGNLTLGTDGAARPYITINSSTVGRALIIGTNEVTQIPPTVDTIWGIAFNRTGGTLSWGDHTKPSAGDFNELIWDPGLGELREERYHETGNHILDRMDRQWGSTMSYTTGLAQWSFAVTDCVWVDELQVTSWAHLKNGHLRLGGSSPGDSALVITQAAETGGGVPAGIAYTAGAHTNLQSGTQAPDVFFALARTKTWDTGAIASNCAVYITAPTHAFEGASTVSKDYTVWLNGAPAGGANCTQTDKGALRATGDVLIEGTAKLDANSTGYSFRAFTSATDGFQMVHNGASSWGLDPLSGSANVLTHGATFTLSGVGNLVKQTMLTGYGADGTYPATSFENNNPATNVLEQWAPTEVRKGKTWSSGASTAYQWRTQETSVTGGGSASTLFHDVWAKLGAGSEVNVMHIPGQTVALTGVLDSATTVAELKATLRNLVNIVKAALPFITDSTT